MQIENWVACPLLWKEWNDEPVVYNIESGNTHLITPITASILRRLDKRPSTFAELAEYLACKVNIDCDDEVIEHVKRLISDLDELGLVKPSNE